jgi:hypothetical protein
MSQSREEAEEELEYALKYDRCPICDGINCEGLPGSCTCCAKCGNSVLRCVCCKYCLETLDLCKCQDRIAEIWKNPNYGFCGHCLPKYDPDNDEHVSVVHLDGTPCPLCCVECQKLLGDDCTCCKKCGKTPCICCTECGELRIKCKCWFEMVSGRVLLHFIRRTVLYHKYHKMKQELRESYFPANTAALITFSNEDSCKSA